MAHVNRYYDADFVGKHIDSKDHRGVIGGMWDEIGHLQFDYVRASGLTPQMRFLDIGCGCLRGGIHFVDYLQPGRYYGIDLSQDLLDAGYDIEIAKAGLQDKLPRANLQSSDDFSVRGFDVPFDMALAVSVFSHLTLNHLKLCLTRLAEVMPEGATFFATVFNCPDDHDWSMALKHKCGKVTHPHRDPFHYRQSDLEYCTRALPWRLDRLEEWNHPRDQWMAVFTRT